MVEAEKYPVMPLDASGLERLISTKPSIVAGRTEFGQEGKPIFVYNLLDLNRGRIEGRQPLSVGKHTVAIDFKYDGPGLIKRHPKHQTSPPRELLLLRPPVPDFSVAR